MDPQGLKHVIDTAQIQSSNTLLFEVLPMVKMSTETAANFLEEVNEDMEVQDAYKAYQLALAMSKERKVAMTAPASTAATGSSSKDITPPASSDKKMPQFQHKAKVEDATIVQKVFDRIIESLVMMSQGELLAVGPELHKMFVDGCKVNRISVYSAAVNIGPLTQTVTVLAARADPLYMAPILEINVKIQGKHSEIGLYDRGSELVCISENAVKDMGLHSSSDMQFNMCNANGGSRVMLGVVENLQLDIGGISVLAHA